MTNRQAMEMARDALKPFVECNYTYFSGKVLGSDARLMREDVERGRAALSALTAAMQAEDGAVEVLRELVEAQLDDANFASFPDDRWAVIKRRYWNALRRAREMVEGKA